MGPGRRSGCQQKGDDSFMKTSTKAAIGGGGAATIGVAGLMAFIALGSGIELVTFSITPNVADTTTVADAVTCTMTLTDTGTTPGIANTGCNLVSPSGYETSCISTVRDSGDVDDGIWSCDAPFPALSESGVWTTKYVFITDLDGNTEKALSADLIADIPNVIPDAAELDVTVTSPSQDLTGPAISAFSITPTAIDFATSNALQCEVTAIDTGAGIRDAGCTWLSPSSAARISCITTAEVDDIYSCDMIVAPEDLGDWVLVNIFVRDNAFNLTRFDASEVVEIVQGQASFTATDSGVGGTGGSGGTAGAGGASSPVPSWVQYPGPEWEISTLSAADLGIEATPLSNLKNQTPTADNCGGDIRTGSLNGTCFQRGGCLVHCWGNADVRFQGASTGKAFNGFALQLLIEDGLLTGEETPSEAWPASPNDCGGTLAQIFDMEGGYFYSNGYSDGCSNACGGPGVGNNRYSSGGHWRLNQVMTYITELNFGEDLKEYLQRKLFTTMDIASDDWYWMTGLQVFNNEAPENHDVSQTVTYPDWSDYPTSYYGCFIDPPYSINGKAVYGGGGWVGMAPKDMARISLLMAGDGWWKDEKLITVTSLVGEKQNNCGGNGLLWDKGGSYSDMYGWGRSGQASINYLAGGSITGPIDDPTSTCTVPVPSACGSKTPDLSTSADAWVDSAQQTASTESLTFEVYARAATADSIVTVSSVPITTFGDAAMLVRFDTDGFFDVRNAGAYACDDCGISWAADTWYKITITANVTASTYSVDVGLCDDTQSRVITDAAFRTGAPTAGGMDYYSIWSQTGTVGIEGASWDGQCTPATCGGLGFNCDIWPDGCGDTVDCGTCGGGDVCDSGSCCTPDDFAAVCTTPGYECGDWSDGCTDSINCGSCAVDEFCLAGTCTPIASGDCDCGSKDTGNPCTGQQASYTRDGETITFNFQCDGGNCLCGTFTGDWDYWVAPPTPGDTVTITSMTPDPTGSGSSYRNGAQYGPTSMDNVNGWDGRSVIHQFGSYSAALSISVPEVVTPSSGTQTVMKAISNTDGTCETETGRICLAYVETLTVLDDPPGDTFRPAYFGTQKTLFAGSLLDTSFLSELAPVSGSITWDKALAITRSVHPHNFVYAAEQRQGYAAKVNIQSNRGYDAFYSNNVNSAMLKMTEEATGADVAKKQQLAAQVAQLGIDLWGIHNEGKSDGQGICGPWVPIGGFGLGRFAPLLFGNELLQQSWDTSINTALSTLKGKGCFGETGWVQPISVTSVGKNVPLFGHIEGGGALRTYYTGGSCNLINENYLTDGGHASCGTPLPYQVCCTHGDLLSAALVIWLTPQVFNNYPSNGDHFLTYMDRARTTGVAAGAEYGSYSDTGSFNVTGYSGEYNPPATLSTWDAYAACSMRGTQDCTGFQ